MNRSWRRNERPCGRSESPSNNLWVSVLLRARAKITSHFAVGSQACRQGAQDAKVQWKAKKQGAQTKIPRGLRAAAHGARRRPGICGVAAPRRCTLASPASRRLASARPALAPKCELIFARTLSPNFLPFWQEIFTVETQSTQRWKMQQPRITRISQINFRGHGFWLPRRGRRCAPFIRAGIPEANDG